MLYINPYRRTKDGRPYYQKSRPRLKSAFADRRKRRVHSRAARAAVRKLDAFMLVFDEFEMLDCLTPDGEHRQQHDADEATQMRKKLCRVFGYLERGVA